MQTFAVERPTTEELTFNSPENGRERLDDDFNTETDRSEEETGKFTEEENPNGASDEEIESGAVFDKLAQFSARERGGKEDEIVTAVTEHESRNLGYFNPEGIRINAETNKSALEESIDFYSTQKKSESELEEIKARFQEIDEQLLAKPNKFIKVNEFQTTIDGKPTLQVGYAIMDSARRVSYLNINHIANEEVRPEEEELVPVETDTESDADTLIDAEQGAEEGQPAVNPREVEQQALAEAIAELLAEDELETEEEQVNNVAAIAKTTLVTQSVVSIAERMKRVAVLFAEPEMSVISEPKPELKSELKPEPKQDEASLKIPETVEVSAAISSSALSPEITSTVQDELQTEVSSKIKVEAQVAEKSISEIEAGSPTIVLREVTEESTLIPTSEKEDIVVVFEVENVAEVVNVPLPEIVSEIQEVVADVVEKTNDEIVVPIKDLDISSDTPFLETSVTDIRSEENANQTRIENLVDSNSELATEAAFEVIMDKIVTESVIDTPVITTTREVIHKETTTEITSEDSKEQVSETIKTSEIKEVVALPIKETLAPAKKVEPIGIKLVRIEAGEIARADSPIEARARVETLEAEATLKGNVLQREILTTQSPESFSRRQYLSYIFPEDIQVTSALREVPANDNREVTESRATVAARNGIIMRLVA
jgi:hypothetical protein